MPLLADPKLDVFKAYRAFDDFEGQPLHGTFLIDAEGNARYQRISAEPFLDVDFIKAESARVNRLVKP
jgi:alkyl hydroperoxide reductase subunit AhpC